MCRDAAAYEKNGSTTWKNKTVPIEPKTQLPGNGKEKKLRPKSTIDSDVANEPYSAANTAVPAEFASHLSVEWFIDNIGRNRGTFTPKVCKKSRQKVLDTKNYFRDGISYFQPFRLVFQNRNLYRLERPWMHL